MSDNKVFMADDKGVRRELQRWQGTRHAVVWFWEDSPLALRRYSGHGGDEDWVALVPAAYGEPRWVDAMGICDVQEIKLNEDWYLYIGAHS